MAFAGLVLIGGLIGFKKAKSKASLIASVVSTLALTYCYWFSHQSALPGLKLAFILIGVLEGIFIVRLLKTKKFMPSGLMLILCGIEQSILFYALKNI